MPFFLPIPRVFGLLDPMAEQENEQEHLSLFDSGYAIFDTVLEKISLTIGSRPVET